MGGRSSKCMDFNLFSFRKISAQETMLSLNNLNPNKAIGFDMIPPHIKNRGRGAGRSIFNQCISEKHWPNSWKKGDN